MTKEEEPLLRRQPALSEPIGETSRYLLSLLDGKTKGKKKRQGDCPPRTAAGGARAAPSSAAPGARPPFAVRSTSSSSTSSRPKAPALSVQTLDRLPGASKLPKRPEVAKKSAAGRKAPSSQHLSLLPSSKDWSTSLPEKNPISRTATEVREATPSINLNGEIAAVPTTTKPTKPGAARVSLEDSAPSRSLSLLNRPIKRPRYLHHLQEPIFVSRGSENLNRSADEDISSNLFAVKRLDVADGSSTGLDNIDDEQISYEKRPLLQATNKKIQLPRDSASESSGNDNFLAGNTWQQPTNLAAVRQEISRPDKPCQADSSARSSAPGNYIRLNLRNKAGACRGARNKKQQQSGRRSHRPTSEEAAMRPQASTGSRASSALCPTSGVDPVDDFMDGMYSVKSDDKENVSQDGKPKSRSSQSAIPNCSGHQYPCKLLTVKKNTENKGRKFYCCSFPREEQCNHFEWADDTVEAARMAMMKNKSVSGFIARHVASYMDQIKQHTVPELKHILKRHGLSTTGCKKQMMTRLAIWVRDEIAQATAEDDDGADEPVGGTVAKGTVVDSISLSSSDASDEDEDSDDSSDDDLEVASRSRTIEAGAVCDEETTESLFLDEDTDKDEPCDPKFSKKRFLSLLKKLFGHSKFRDGQEWAIRRCLANEKTLLVAPTGFGKSLCYTMTAALKDGVCIVVSPLLSLIQDQLRLLPPGIAAVTLSGSMTRSKIAATLDDIARGRIKIVFVSPERLTSSSFRRLFRPKWDSMKKVYERIFPPVSLVCIDEAHCLSQWAHHFRPSYLRLRSAMTLIQPQSVLAITATAGPKVVDDICQILDIQFDISGTANAGGNHGGVRIMQPERDNIDVSCYIHSSQDERLAKLIDILSLKRHAKSGSDRCSGLLSSGSVIVYVWRQRDAEAVAENIQAATDIVGGVTVYHGGMDSIARRQAQSKFMRGKIRICVATVAFGLGINKNDVAGVVHMYLSASPEHFLQETGRAGRDGRPAHAIALILEEEALIRHSLTHSDLISRSQVETFLRFLVSIVQQSANGLPEGQARDTSMHTGLMISECMAACDCKAETVETFASLLEQNGLLQVEGWFYDRALISPRRKSLARLANTEPVARAIIQCAESSETPAGQHRQCLIDDGNSGSYSVSVTQCANRLGPNAAPRHVLAALRRMKLCGDIEYTLDASDGGKGLHLHILNTGLEIFRVEGTTAIAALALELTERLNSTIDALGNKALILNHILRQIAKEPPEECVDNKSARLHLFQKLIREYFMADGLDELVTKEIDLPSFASIDQPQLLADVRCVFNYLSDLQGSIEKGNCLRFGECPDFTSLLIAKFLAGLHGSSRFPLSMAFHHSHFGRLQSCHFKTLHTAVKNVISN